MNKYRKLILNSLIDKYEKSRSFIGQNKVNQSINLNFNKRTIKDYFDDSGDSFYEINDVCKELSDKNFINIKWKNNQEDHIIEKVILNKELVEDICEDLCRKDKNNKNSDFLYLLNQYKGLNSVLDNFINYISERLHENKSIKQYIDIEKIDEATNILYALSHVLSNYEDVFLREFSIRLFSDSKKFEAIEKKVVKIIKDFSNKNAFLETEDILSEFYIFKNPSYVYFKGTGFFSVNNQSVELVNMPNGIGINSLDIADIRFCNISELKRIITIENLTSYNRFKSENTLVIYLGGYHNKARRKLLQEIYKVHKECEFFHWGDIDVGGFKIFNHLRKTTEIPFKPFNMDKETLMKYKKYSKSLTSNDEKQLRLMLNNDVYECFHEVIEYMLEIRSKLEQEII